MILLKSCFFSILICFMSAQVYGLNPNNESQFNPSKKSISKDTTFQNAKWIGACPELAKVKGACFDFKHEFVLKKSVSSATIFVTSRGLYDLRLNEQNVTSNVLTPGWTNYKERINFQKYDVKELFNPIRNLINITLAEGWYKGRLGNHDNGSIYSDTIAFIFSLEVIYEDGEKEVISSDNDWKYMQSQIRNSSIYDGELYQERNKNIDSEWSNSCEYDLGKDQLCLDEGPPIIVGDTLLPVAIHVKNTNSIIVDFGKIISGKLNIKLQNIAGADTIRLRHSESLKSNLNLDLFGLRTARQEDIFILNSKGNHVLEPVFTFHGFRYVEIISSRNAIKNATFKALEIHSLMERRIDFSTSNSTVNKLFENALQTQKNNFIGIPMDSPQRDERLGWTGDAQIFSATSMLNFDTYLFWKNWLENLDSEQNANGTLPFVIPDIGYPSGAIGWDDALVIVPYNLYKNYGDLNLLEEHYNKFIKKYANHLMEKNLKNSNVYFGDWHNRYKKRLKKEYFNFSYSLRTLGIICEIANLLGRKEDYNIYKNRLIDLRKNWNEEYILEDGSLMFQNQSAYALAIGGDLLDANAEKINEDFVKLLEKDDFLLKTGYICTPLIFESLSRLDSYSIADIILSNSKYPSWRFQIEQNASSFWEKWDNLDSNGNIRHNGMNSFSHMGFASISEWLVKEYGPIKLKNIEWNNEKFICELENNNLLLTKKIRLKTKLGLFSISTENGILKINVPKGSSLDLIRGDKKTNLQSGEFEFELNSVFEK